MKTRRHVHWYQINSGSFVDHLPVNMQCANMPLHTYGTPDVAAAKMPDLTMGLVDERIHM